MRIVASTEPVPFPTELDLLSFHFEDLPRQMRRIVDASLEEYDLGRTQWRLLAYTLRQEGLTQTELARLLEIERASAGLAIDALEKKGLVKRHQHAEDRRVWRIIPTDKAKGLVGELRETVDEVYAQLFRGFSKAELEQLGSFFTRIAKNLRSAEAE